MADGFHREKRKEKEEEKKEDEANNELTAVNSLAQNK